MFWKNANDTIIFEADAMRTIQVLACKAACSRGTSRVCDQAWSDFLNLVRKLDMMPIGHEPSVESLDHLRMTGEILREASVFLNATEVEDHWSRYDATLNRFANA